jgi:hypothetical protein
MIRCIQQEDCKLNDLRWEEGSANTVIAVMSDMMRFLSNVRKESSVDDDCNSD